MCKLTDELKEAKKQLKALSKGVQKKSKKKEIEIAEPDDAQTPNQTPLADGANIKEMVEKQTLNLVLKDDDLNKDEVQGSPDHSP